VSSCFHDSAGGAIFLQRALGGTTLRSQGQWLHSHAQGDRCAMTQASFAIERGLRLKTILISDLILPDDGTLGWSASNRQSAQLDRLPVRFRSVWMQPQRACSRSGRSVAESERGRAAALRQPQASRAPPPQISTPQLPRVAQTTSWSLQSPNVVVGHGHWQWQPRPSWRICLP
jgi:hypothetical protein